MKHLIARHSNYFVVGLKDRAYLVFDAKADNDSPAGSVLELLPPPDPKEDQQSEPAPASDKKSEEPSDPAGDKKHFRNKVHDRRKSADEQLNEICAVAIIAENGKETQTFHCAVARNNKTLDIYTVKIENLSQQTSQPFLQYRTPKRVSSFTSANIATSSESATPVPVLISVDLAGDSYAYNLTEKGERLLLGHTASMLTDVAIANNGSDNCLLLTSDRDEKIRISRFPETYIIEGFLLGHEAFVTGFALIPSSSPTLLVSCGGDMTLRLWDLSAQIELSSTPTSNDENNNASEIPTAIATSGCGSIVAIIFDDSKRLSIYKINQGDTPSLELLENVECPSQPLSIIFNEIQTADSTSSELTVLMKDPDFVVVYDVQHTKEDVSKPIAAPKNEIGVMQAMKDAVSEKKIAMPNTILEKDDFGKPVLQKENETRGPAGAEAPWNRVERVEIAKEREKRRKKRPKLANDN